MLAVTAAHPRGGLPQPQRCCLIEVGMQSAASSKASRIIAARNHAHLNAIIGCPSISVTVSSQPGGSGAHRAISATCQMYVSSSPFMFRYRPICSTCVAKQTAHSKWAMQSAVYPGAAQTSLLNTTCNEPMHNGPIPTLSAQTLCWIAPQPIVMVVLLLCSVLAVAHICHPPETVLLLHTASLFCGLLWLSPPAQWVAFLLQSASAVHNLPCP